MAVAHDASGSAYNGAPGATVDFAALMTVGGSATAAKFGICVDTAATTITSVTWDQGATNQAATSLGAAVTAPASNGKIFLFGLVNPTPGLKTLRVVFSTIPNEAFVFGESVTGSETSSVAAAFTNYATNTGTSTTTSVAVTSAAGNLTVEMSSGPQVLSAPTQTQIFVNNSGAVTSAGASRAAGAATVTHQWTLAGAVGWAAAGVNIVAAGGAPPGDGGGATSVRPRGLTTNLRPAFFKPGIARRVWARLPSGLLVPRLEFAR